MAQTLFPPPLQSTSVSLTAANILAMNGTPVTIIAAPGAGKAIIVNQILFEMTTTSTQFANGGTVNFQYHGTSTNVHSSTIPASVVTATAGTTNTLLAQNTAANGITVPANTAVEITNGTAPFITGTGTAKVQIWYSVITL